MVPTRSESRGGASRINVHLFPPFLPGTMAAPEARRGGQSKVVIQNTLRAISKIGPEGWKRIVPLSAGAAVGIGAGVKGAVDTAKGNRTRKDALQRLDESVAEYEASWVNTERVFLEYRAFQMSVHEETVARFAAWLERNKHLVTRLDLQKVDGVRIQAVNIPRYVATIQNVTTSVSRVTPVVGLGDSVESAAWWGINKFGHSGTGRSIASLSGAAAESARKAWPAGGPKSAGAGGMAVGEPVLDLVKITPALLIVGMKMSVAGILTKNEACRFAAAVEDDIEQRDNARDSLCTGEGRVKEHRVLLGRLAEQANGALEALEALEFDPKLHEREFSRSHRMVTAITEVINTPVFDPESEQLTEASTEVLRKYAWALPTKSQP